jgi:hypothetical protein
MVSQGEKEAEEAPVARGEVICDFFILTILQYLLQ